MPFPVRSTLRALALATLLVAPTLSLAEAPAPTTKPVATLFDPARHLALSEIKPGMKGYVRTVVSGTKLEQFDVEVVSILRNQFGPGRDVILIRCKGEYMEHVVGVAGMSGSPVYLIDDAGKPRLAGAYAYGWDMAKDPLAGVQPIEYMTKLVPGGAPEAGAKPANASQRGEAAQRVRWSLIDSGFVPAFDSFSKRVDIAKPRSSFDTSSTQLRPLAVPFAASGLSPRSAELLRQLLEPQLGMRPMIAGASSGEADAKPIPIEPGSVLVAPLVTGDLELAGVGTATEVIGDRVLAFGHPMFGDGAAAVPFSGGSINVIVPMLTASFKIGTSSAIQGVIDRDSEVGIAGTIGSKAKMFPLTIKVATAQGATKTYNYQVAMHPGMAGQMVAVTTLQTATAGGELPAESTLDFKMAFDFGPDRIVNVAGLVPSTEGGAVDVARGMMLPMMVALNNPFERVEPRGVTVDLTVKPGIDQWTLDSAAPDRTHYEPGDAVKLHLTFKRYRAGETTKDVSFTLPADLEPGDYQLQVLDAASNLQAEAQAHPNKFVVEDASELFETMKLALPQDVTGLNLRLTRQPGGISVGRTALQRLPGSRRLVYGALGRTDVQPVSESIIQKVLLGDVAITAATDVAIKVVKKK
jgi:hypothetical protein